MRKKQIITILMVAGMLAVLNGCSGAPKEKQIQQDFETSYFLEDGEQISQFSVEKRKTEKDEDTVWSTDTTQDEKQSDDDNISNDNSGESAGSQVEEKVNPTEELGKDDLKTGDKGNTYITRYSEINAVECPTFRFRYPSDWKVTTEEVGDGSTPIEEHVVIENSRGVTVSYWSCDSALGGKSSVMEKVEIEKAADAAFAPGYAAGTDEDYTDTLGKFMVARVHITGEMWPDEEDDFTEEDGGSFYALLLESRVGTEEIQMQVDNIDDFSFNYPLLYAFIAEAPDGEFTKQEEKQVIEILQSVELASY